MSRASWSSGRRLPAGHGWPLLGRHVGGRRSLEPRGAACLWDARRSQVWGPARHLDIHVSFAPRSESIQGWWKRSAQHLPAAPPSQKANRRVVQAQRVTRHSWMLPRPRSHLWLAVTCPMKVCATPCPHQGGGAGGQVSDPAQTLRQPTPAGLGPPRQGGAYSGLSPHTALAVSSPLSPQP